MTDELCEHAQALLAENTDELVMMITAINQSGGYGAITITFKNGDVDEMALYITRKPKISRKKGQTQP